MLYLCYIYAIPLALIYVYKTLMNDPEKEKIWGPTDTHALLKQKDKEIESLRAQLEHYRNYQPSSED